MMLEVIIFSPYLFICRIQAVLSEISLVDKFKIQEQ